MRYCTHAQEYISHPPYAVDQPHILFAIYISSCYPLSKCAQYPAPQPGSLSILSKLPAPHTPFHLKLLPRTIGDNEWLLLPHPLRHSSMALRIRMQQRPKPLLLAIIPQSTHKNHQILAPLLLILLPPTCAIPLIPAPLRLEVAKAINAGVKAQKDFALGVCPCCEGAFRRGVGLRHDDEPVGVDVVLVVPREQGVRVVGYPLREGRRVVECVVRDGGCGDEDGAEGGGGGVFDLEGGGYGEAG